MEPTPTLHEPLNPTLLAGKDDLLAAVDAGVLGADEVEGLTAFLQQRYKESPEGATLASQCSGTTVLFYIGGALALGAAAAFSDIVAQQMGPGALVGLCAVYAALAALVAEYFRGKNLELPSAIFAAISVVMCAVTVDQLLEKTVGSDVDRQERALVTNAAGIVAAIALLARFRYPLLTLPVAAFVHMLAWDVVPRLVARSTYDYDNVHDARIFVVFVLGCATLGTALQVDINNIGKRDFAFWLWLAGCLSYSGPLIEWSAFANCNASYYPQKLFTTGMQFALIAFGAAISRRSLVFVGAFGVFVGTLSITGCIVNNAIGMVIILSMLAYLFISAGTWWAKNEKQMSHTIRQLLPENVRKVGESRENTW